MLTSTLNLDPSATSVPAGDPSAAGATGLPADGGERFADELAQAQSALPAGQNLAAGTLPLQTLALGPALEVITATSDQPDGDSLAAFAKAQGLDDDVVAWLFSDATQAQVQAQAVVAIPVPPGVMALPTTPAGIAGELPGVATGTGLPSLQVATLAGALSSAPTGVDTATATATGTGLATGLAAATPASATGTPASIAAAALAGATPTVTLAPSAPALTDTATTVPTAQPGAAAAAIVATTAAVAQRAGWLQSLAPTAVARDAASAAQESPLAPAQAMATQVQAFSLGQAVRSGRAAALAEAPSLPSAPGDLPVEILSLEMAPGLEALWDDTGAGQSNPGFAGSDPQGAGTPARDPVDDAQPASNAAQRAAGYQELSHRLGEAMAKRVLSQVERGNWEVRLLLKPAQLGEVEIELSMRSGALDAAFRATNPLTRDLLNDGLSRLREVLNGAGMDIAGLNVGNGRHQQSGGNPTPRQTEGTTAAGPADTTALTATASTAAPRARNTGSGWDVLV